jgi:asparagine synthase (glutamine-hydrolysing)
MGIFILTTCGTDLSRAEAVLVRAGFEPAWQVRDGGTHLLLLRKLNGEGGGVVTREDGEFACGVGTLIRAGKTGTAALDGLLRNFDPEAAPWRDSRGSWCAVLRKHGALHLVNDRLNGAKVYHDGARRVFSNSFVALCEMGRAGGLDAHGCYDYVWNGTVHGTRTFLSGIETMPNDTVATFRDNAVTFTRHHEALPALPAGGLDAVADACLERLKTLFATYAGLWPRSVRSALSGGYDSRLLLALLLDGGLDPSLFVYGDTADPDVKIAKAICAGEGLALEHIDKQAHPPLSPERFAAEVEADLFAFDGWKNAGLFDDGSDRRDRMARSGQVLMNGSVGESFRNFYYLRDGHFSMSDLVGVFHSTYDPAACTAAFDGEAYEETVAADMAAAVGVSAQGRHPRAVMEMCYPLVRGRYWTARDAAINQRFGTSLTPFLEPAVFGGTWSIPLALKSFGRLEARMIARLAPRLAGYGSAYGFPFDAEPPLGYRLAMTLNHWRPLWLRRVSYRLRHRRPEALPPILRPAYLRTVIDLSFPFTRHLFRPGRLHHAEAFNRLCTIEYLAQRYCDGTPSPSGRGLG